MKERYNEIVLKAEKGVEFILSEEGGKLIACASILKEVQEPFEKITSKERKEVANLMKKLKGKTTREKDFLSVVKEGLEEVDYDYWIATIEPTVINEKIRFVEGQEVAVGYTGNDWKAMCENYAKDRGSRIANLYELFIWYAWRIAKGYWTLDYVANDSSTAGNYWNAPNSSHCMEKTGVRKCGGYKDGQGNTYKLVTHKDSLAAVGGVSFCFVVPVAFFLPFCCLLWLWCVGAYEVALTTVNTIKIKGRN